MLTEDEARGKVCGAAAMTAALRAAGVAIAVAVFGLFAHDVSRWAAPAAAEPVAAPRKLNPRPPVFVCWRAGHRLSHAQTFAMAQLRVSEIELERGLALLESTGRWMMLAEAGGNFCIVSEGYSI